MGINKENRIFLAFACVLISLLSFCSSSAGVSITLDPDIELGVGVESSHSFRGLMLSEEAAIDSVAEIDFDWLIADVNVFSAADRGSDRLADGGADATLECRQMFGRHELRAGYGLHGYWGEPAGQSLDTQEILLGYGYAPAIRPGMRFFVDASYDFDRLDGWYCRAGVLDSIDVIDGMVDMDLAVTGGWCDDQYAMFYRDAGSGSSVFRKIAMSDVSVEVEFPVMLGGKFELVPSVKYTSLVDSRIRDGVDSRGLDASSLSAGLYFRFFF